MISLSARVKEIRPECPVIISTGYAAGHDLSETSAEAVLDKPVSSDVWKKTLQSTLAGKPQETELSP